MSRIDERGEVAEESLRGIDELSQLPPAAPPPLSKLLEAELAQLRPVATRRPIRQLALLIAVSLIYGGGLLVMLTVRRDLHALPMSWLVSAGLAWLFGFVAPVTLATLPRAGSMMPRWQLAGIVSVVAAVAMIGLGLMLHPSEPTPGMLGWDGITRGYGCLGSGLATAIVPIVLGTIFLRRALPVGSRWVAAALGAGGGSLGGLVLHLHCPITEGVHVGLVHGGAIVIAALIAAALVPRATEIQ